MDTGISSGYAIENEKVVNTDEDEFHNALPFQWPFPNDIWSGPKMIDDKGLDDCSNLNLATTPDFLLFLGNQKPEVIFRVSKYKWRYLTDSKKGIYTEYDEWRLSMPLSNPKEFRLQNQDRFLVFEFIKKRGNVTYTLQVDLPERLTLDTLYDLLQDAATKFKERNQNVPEINFQFVKTPATVLLEPNTLPSKFKVRARSNAGLGLFEKKRDNLGDYTPFYEFKESTSVVQKPLVLNPQYSDDYEFIAAVRVEEKLSLPGDPKPVASINYFQLNTLFEKVYKTDPSKNLESNVLFRSKENILKGVLQFCSVLNAEAIVLQDAALIATRSALVSTNQQLYVSLYNVLSGKPLFYAKQGVNRVVVKSTGVDVTSSVESLRSSFKTSPYLIRDMKRWTSLRTYFQKHGVGFGLLDSMTLYQAFVFLYGFLFGEVLEPNTGLVQNVPGLFLDGTVIVDDISAFRKINDEFIQESVKFIDDESFGVAGTLDDQKIVKENTLVFDYWMQQFVAEWCKQETANGNNLADYDILGAVAPFDDTLRMYTLQLPEFFTRCKYIPVPNSLEKNVPSGSLGQTLKAIQDKQNIAQAIEQTPTPQSTPVEEAIAQAEIDEAIQEAVRSRSLSRSLSSSRSRSSIRSTRSPEEPSPEIPEDIPEETPEETLEEIEAVQCPEITKPASYWLSLYTEPPVCDFDVDTSRVVDFLAR